MILVAGHVTGCDNAAGDVEGEIGKIVLLEQRYDAIVICSGVGGSCAAALLADEGYKVLLAEKRAYLGGRFSTSDHDGYLCATGGLAVQVGGPIEKICAQIGIESGVRPASR